ncbi:ABC transporter related protein [Desulfurispirillum indicum S5]|uniref:ABC transporter related protein n=1 Tax=Desulfurispirillum indicum (strain ATCC BAA-1389 / DSM 22839 / S5) TaxID=653733 RepID=E6W641_DESIS|nr:ABC transporter ATP-binding protein [Desulfurispirillum indicum]ADU64980.1 ABC transporter related protein [Desulfurispirillum indicum S5]
MSSLLSVSGVGKSYRRYRSELSRVASWFFPRITAQHEKWILRNISFEVQAGESIGLIGENGAGKSTLLKIIAGTLPPTEGSVTLRGRIGAILELGMGFNPELTGRQNAQHSLGLMGFTPRQIQQQIEQIEHFAEIHEYFDAPLRVYSSGMQARLAFAIVSAYRPEILVIDEAFSVGDMYFQHKSFDRIRSFREQGTALIVVSHDANSIKTLCNRAILLSQGSVQQEGAPSEVLDYYNALIAHKEGSGITINSTADASRQVISGTAEVKTQEIYIRNHKGQVTDTLEVGERVTLQVKVKVLLPVAELVFGYALKNRYGQVMFGTNTFYTQDVLFNLRPQQQITYSVEFPVNLGVGSYSVSTALHSAENHLKNNYEWKDLALVFDVTNTSREKFSGNAWIPPTKVQIDYE